VFKADYVPGYNKDDISNKISLCQPCQGVVHALAEECGGIIFNPQKRKKK
jgi:hypothetical protein